MILTTRSELEPLFHGHLDFEEREEGLMPLRLPLESKPFAAPGLWGRATNSAGVRLRFITDAKEIVLKFRLGVKENQNHPKVLIDLLLPGEKPRTFQTEEGAAMQELVLPGPFPPDQPIEIFLPIAVSFTLQDLEARGPSFVRPVADPCLRWITYGSSITQCGAASPSRTWPALAAKALNWNLTCLGYGGNCQFDQIVARAIAAAPADRISCCLGINTRGGFFSPRTWAPAVEGLIFTIRDKHPKTPLLIIFPICCPKGEIEEDTSEVMGLPVMRRRLVEIVEKFRATGDNHIHYLDGLRLMGPEDVHLLPDGLHPNAEGYELLGQRFAELAPAEWTSGSPSPSASQ